MLRCLTEKMEDITDAECKKEVFYFVKMEARCPSHWGLLGLKSWQGMPLQLVNSQLALEAVHSAASESWLALSGTPNQCTASVGTHSTLLEHTVVAGKSPHCWSHQLTLAWSCAGPRLPQRRDPGGGLPHGRGAALPQRACRYVVGPDAEGLLCWSAAWPAERHMPPGRYTVSGWLANHSAPCSLSRTPLPARTSWTSLTDFNTP